MCPGSPCLGVEESNSMLLLIAVIPDSDNKMLMRDFNDLSKCQELWMPLDANPGQSVNYNSIKNFGCSYTRQTSR